MATGSATLGAAEPYLIQQQWTAYTAEQHATWAELVGRRMPRLKRMPARNTWKVFIRLGSEPT